MLVPEVEKDLVRRVQVLLHTRCRQHLQRKIDITARVGNSTSFCDSDICLVSNAKIVFKCKRCRKLTQQVECCILLIAGSHRDDEGSDHEGSDVRKGKKSEKNQAAAAAAPPVKILPAPPPKENIWEKRKQTATTAPSTSSSATENKTSAEVSQTSSSTSQTVDKEVVESATEKLKELTVTDEKQVFLDVSFNDVSWLANIIFLSSNLSRCIHSYDSGGCF